MTENKKQANKDKIDEILSSALKGMTEEECFGWEEEPSISIDELEALVLVERNKRRRKRIKFLSLAVAAITLCIIGCVTVLPKLTAVEADKNKQEIVEKNNGTVIIKEKEGDDLPENQDIVSVREITDWDKIAAHKEKYVPDMRIPGWIPEGYAFDRLVIERFYNGTWDCEYQFETKQGKELDITESPLDPNAQIVFHKDPDRVIESKIGMVYITENKEENILMGSYRDKDIFLYVSGEDISEADLIQIFDNLG